MPTDTLRTTLESRPAVTATAAAGATARGLHETTALIAATAPGLPALRQGETTVDYGRLDAIADAWAADLAAAGVGRGAIVPILLPRGLDAVTALLAVLKTGAAYALLDPAWPIPRLSQAVAALPDPTVLIGPPDTAIAALPVWSPPTGPFAADPGFRPAAVSGTDPCCVFFTSGTTGLPKAVLIPHRAIARLFPAHGFAEFGPQTVVPLAAPTPWDAFALELWSVLLTGGTSSVVGEPYLSAVALREAVALHGANCLWLTAGLFNMIVDEDLDAFAGVRQVMTGGERLSPEHVRRFLRRHGDVALLNGYGPVENTVFATTRRLTEADCDRPGGVPLGRAVPGTAVHVLDDGRACGPGTVGEICVSGTGLGIGYLGDDAQTAEKFVNARIDGRTVRVYRTGDLGAWGADGLLEFRGRADRQVKIRGHRVEPEEVEREILQALPQVRECRVLVRRPDPGSPAELLAFCRPVEPGDDLEGAAATLRAGLVAYHRPAAVISLDRFPVTDRGKLDETALLALARAIAPSPAEPAAAPRNEPSPAAGPGDGPAAEVERAFREILGRDSVPAEAHFAELGGDSLMAGRVCARLGTRLGRPIPLSVFHQHASVRALAAWLESGPGGPGGSAAVTASAPEQDGVALTPLQLVYLTRQLQQPDDPAAACLLVWRVEPEPDREALAAAVAAVHARHEPLRSVYTADPRPAAYPVDVPEPPLTLLPARGGLAEAEAALRAELTAGLDLETAEVWRTALIPVASEGCVLFGVAVHHIAFDGWSESVLAAEISAAYSAAPLAPVPDSARVAAVLAQRRALVDTAAQCERSAAELAGVPDLRWTGGESAAPAAAGSEPVHRVVPIPPAEIREIEALAASCGTTRFNVLLALFGSCLAEVTGQDDFAVGVPAAQRDSPEITSVIGCHITTLCVRLRPAALGGDDEAVRETARAVALAAATQDVPTAELFRRLGRPRTGRPPLYQVMFALQDNASARLNLPGSRTSLRRQPYLGLPLELHVELWPAEDGGLTLVVSHRPEAVPARTADALAQRYAARLSAVAPDAGAAPDRPEPVSHRVQEAHR